MCENIICMNPRFLFKLESKFMSPSQVLHYFQYTNTRNEFTFTHACSCPHVPNSKLVDVVHSFVRRQQFFLAWLRKKIKKERREGKGEKKEKEKK